MTTSLARSCWWLGLAAMFATGIALADESAGNDQDPLSKAKSWAINLEAATRIASDPVLRSIVCRVPFANFTIEAIMRATKIPGPRLKRAVQRLENMNLINVVRQGNVMRIVPANEKARAKMREWANKWCTSDDECGVAR